MSLLNSFTISPETINTDLTKERPIWRLSSYAPGRDPPAQLVDGKDISPEELRFRAWELNMQGMGQQFANEVQQLEAAIDTQISYILRDLSGAVKFMTDANKTREGYRYKAPSGTAPTSAAPTLALAQSTSAFGAPAAASSFGFPTSAFGATTQTPSAFGESQQPASAFGQPAFGGTAPAFAAKTPAFGQSSMGLSSSTTPAFGQPAFGKPAFGQPAFGQPAFGVTAAPAVTNATIPAFGQTVFSNAVPTSAFVGQQQPQTAFGTSSAQPPSAFGKPAFGQPAFVQPAFGQTASPFTAAAAGQQQTANPFGQAQQPSTPTTGSFGQAVNAFSSPAQQAPVAAFSQPQQQQPVSAYSGLQQPISAFSTASAASAQGAFGQATGAFAKQPPAGQAPPSAFGQTAFLQPQQQTSAFGGGRGGAFGNLLNPQPEAPVVQMGGGTSVAGGNSADGIAGGAGGKWDDPPVQCTDAELRAFRASEFALGSIPLVPPPQELCR